MGAWCSPGQENFSKGHQVPTPFQPPFQPSLQLQPQTQPLPTLTKFCIIRSWGRDLTELYILL